MKFQFGTSAAAPQGADDRLTAEFIAHIVTELCPDRASAGGPVYVLRLQAKTDDAGVRGLRAVLKFLLRRYGLVCRDAYEERP